MSYNPQNPNGQATSANSAPVVIASDQSAVPVSGTVTANIGTAGSLALDASVTGQQVAQGSATSGQKGSLIQGAVTTGAPSYITAQTSPLSLTTAGALRVDPSGSTQPISGTVTVQQGTAANLKVDLSGTAANATAIKVDGSATTQPVSGTLGITANSSVNVNQVGGTAVDTNSGNKSAGTQRVVLATDQPNLTTPLNTNVAQINGVTTSMGNGVSGTGVQRVTLASDSTGQVALATGANTIGSVGINAGTNAIGSVNLAPTTTGGWSVSSQTNLTNTTTVSGAPGKFGGYMFINLNSTPAYIQVFDTTGSPTLGAATFVIPIPANGTPANGVGANLEMTNGIAITAGIKIAATTSATGSGIVSTGLIGYILYK